MFFLFFFSIVIFFPCFFSPVAHLVRNLLTRLDVSSNPGTSDFVFKKNLNASKPSEHPPQVEECLKV